jgi:hypothetical protein
MPTMGDCRLKLRHTHPVKTGLDLFVFGSAVVPEMRLRCVTHPEAAQTTLLERLSVTVTQTGLIAQDLYRRAPRSLRGLTNNVVLTFFPKSLIQHCLMVNSAQVGLVCRIILH